MFPFEVEISIFFHGLKIVLCFHWFSFKHLWNRASLRATKLDKKLKTM